MALANLPPSLAYEFIALLAMFPSALKQHLRGYVDRNQLIAIYKLYRPTTALSTHAASQGGKSHESPYLEAVLDSKNMPMTITLFLSCLAAPLRDRERRAPRLRARVVGEGPAPGGPRLLDPRGRGPDGPTADRQNFGKILLVFGCIGTDLCKQIRVFQHFSKSTRLSN